MQHAHVRVLCAHMRARARAVGGQTHQRRRALEGGKEVDGRREPRTPVGRVESSGGRGGGHEREQKQQHTRSGHVHTARRAACSAAVGAKACRSSEQEEVRRGTSKSSGHRSLFLARKPSTL